MRSSRYRPRPEPPEEVPFPVTPMLDMAFQLLAFFVLTFRVPSSETRIDLDLPVAPVALPGKPSPGTTVEPASDLESDLILTATSAPDGSLASLRLNGSPVDTLDTLIDRLTRYRALLNDRPLRIALSADDRLLYDHAARLISACTRSGATTIKLTTP